MKNLISYICSKCKQPVVADEAMPHIAERHIAPLTPEEEAAGKEPVECVGSGFPTKKNITDPEEFVRRAPMVFSSL